MSVAEDHNDRPASRLGIASIVVGVLSAGVVLVMFGLGYGSLHSDEGDLGSRAADRQLDAPVAVEASPVLSVSGVARDADGIQELEVDTDGGEFVPDHLQASPGVPLRIRFSRGSGDAVLVSFPDLGISADLSRGPTSVKLPALEQGTYPFRGARGEVTGLLVIR